jgi:hypothetical protein
VITAAKPPRPGQLPTITSSARGLETETAGTTHTGCLHLLMRHGLRSALEDSQRITVVAGAGGGAEAAPRTEGLGPDVLVLGTWSHAGDPPPLGRLTQRSRVLILSHVDEAPPVE